MTLRGLLLLLAAIILFVMADFTRTGWVQLADSLLWAVLVVSFFISWGSVVHLGIRLRIVPGPRFSTIGATEGDEAAYVLEIENRWPWPRFGLHVTAALKVNGAERQTLGFYVPVLGPTSTAKVPGHERFHRRGRHELHEAVVESRAPFGLFRRKRRMSVHTSAVVYPAPYTIGSILDRDRSEGETPLPVTKRRGEEISGSRPYAPGDPARDIHWRNYARSGRLATRSYVATASQASVLVLGGKGVAEAVLDDVVRLAAGAGERWRGEDGGTQLQIGASSTHKTMQGLLGALALLTSEKLPDLSTTLQHVPRDAALVAVVPSSDRAGGDALVRAASAFRGVRALVLDDDGGASGLATRLSGAGASVMVYEHPLPHLHDPVSNADRQAQPAA